MYDLEKSNIYYKKCIFLLHHIRNESDSFAFHGISKIHYTRFKQGYNVS